MLHPAQYFTQDDVTRERDLIQKSLADHQARLATLRPSKPMPPIVFADCYEARDARKAFEAQPDAERNLAEAHEEQFELCELIAAMERVLASNPTDHEKRKLLGYEEKVKPSLPGILDTYFHVDGNIDRARTKLAEIERRLPRLEAEAARYAQVKAALAPWPWSRISRERSAVLKRQLIVNGEMPVKRGALL
jgi:hypothetical protein